MPGRSTLEKVKSKRDPFAPYNAIFDGRWEELDKIFGGIESKLGDGGTAAQLWPEPPKGFEPLTGRLRIDCSTN